MKKILLFASAALLFAGCAKENITPIENPDNSQKGDITLSFSASQTGFGTKAIIGETTTDAEGAKSTPINWQSTDQISVFDGAKENCQFSTKGFSTEAPSCTFEGNVTLLANDYTAVYPYTEGATISESGVISGVTLPATQTAVAGSFDPSAALMVAKTVEGGRALAFKNLVGYVKVITDFDCKQIELCAASGEKLAGEGTISFNEVTPSFALGDGAESTITLLPEVKGATIAAGTYYIAVPATTLAAGWSIRLTGTDDIVSTKKGSKDITFKQSTVLNLGTISKIEPRYLTFSAESKQIFKMDFQPDEAAAFTLDDGEYFEYRVGKDEWTLSTGTIRDVPFGGSHGDLQLRGISSKGTAVSNATQWTTISFGNDTKVSCSGDIRTLVNYKDYENANTSNARFCNLFNNCLQLTSAPDLPATELASKCYYCMFKHCESLTTAPDLPATKLAALCYYGMFCECTALTTAPELPAKTLKIYCYQEMFRGCTALSSVTMLATDVSAEMCLENWLSEAGTNVQGYRTLTLSNQGVYNEIQELQNNYGFNYLPYNWSIEYKYQ